MTSCLMVSCSYLVAAREDLSPVNGYGLDNGDLSKKKKGPAARQQEELCLVCGDRASGKPNFLKLSLPLAFPLGQNLG